MYYLKDGCSGVSSLFFKRSRQKMRIPHVRRDFFFYIIIYYVPTVSCYNIVNLTSSVAQLTKLDLGFGHPLPPPTPIQSMCLPGASTEVLQVFLNFTAPATGLSRLRFVVSMSLASVFFILELHSLVHLRKVACRRFSTGELSMSSINSFHLLPSRGLGIILIQAIFFPGVLSAFCCSRARQ